MDPGSLPPITATRKISPYNGDDTVTATSDETKKVKASQGFRGYVGAMTNTKIAARDKKKAMHRTLTRGKGGEVASYTCAANACTSSGSDLMQRMGASSAHSPKYV